MLQLVRNRVVFPSAEVSEGQGKLYAALSLLLLVVTGSIDINTACGYGRATDRDVACGSSPGPNDIMDLGGSADFLALHNPWLSPQILTLP